MKVNTIIECYGYIKWFYLIDVIELKYMYMIVIAILVGVW